MSLNTPKDQPSLKHGLIHEDKKMSSPNPITITPYNVIPFDLRFKTTEKTENYEKKNGTRKFKINSQNKNEAYIQSKNLAYAPYAKENWLKLNFPLLYPNLSYDSNCFVGKKLEFEKINCQESRPSLTQQKSPLGQNSYFGTYIPQRNLFPDNIFLSKIFDKNLEISKNFYLAQPYPNLFLIPKKILLPKVTIPKAPIEKEIKGIKTQEIIKPNELIKLNLNIPDEFLISFQLKEIVVKTIDLNQLNQNDQKSKQIWKKNIKE